MNMIRHNNIAVKIIIGVFPMPNRSDHHLRYLRLSKVMRPRTSGIEKTIHR
jgi:desulfoferrodoxin (superoxide reductase-like protein)